MVTYTDAPNSPRIPKHVISMRWLASQIEVVTTFLVLFRAHMNISLTVKSEYPCALNGHIGSHAKLC